MRWRVDPATLLGPGSSPLDAVERLGPRSNMSSSNALRRFARGSFGDFRPSLVSSSPSLSSSLAFPLPLSTGDRLSSSSPSPSSPETFSASFAAALRVFTCPTPPASWATQFPCLSCPACWSLRCLAFREALTLVPSGCIRRLARSCTVLLRFELLILLSCKTYGEYDVERNLWIARGKRASVMSRLS